MGGRFLGGAGINAAAGANASADGGEGDKGKSALWGIAGALRWKRKAGNPRKSVGLGGGGIGRDTTPATGRREPSGGFETQSGGQMRRRLGKGNVQRTGMVFQEEYES